MVSQNQKTVRRKHTHQSFDALARLLLAGCATIALLTILIVVALTNNNTLLLATGPLGMAVAPAFRYYFPDRQQQK